MFKIGDEVRILDTENRDCYKQILTKKGKIAQITNYKHFADDIERTKYYVEIPEYQNEYQSDGLWVFHNEMSIALTSNEVTCDDQLDAYEYATQYIDFAEIVNRNKQYKGDNYMTILEIYAERRREKINKKYDDMENAIKQCDPRYKVWKGCVDTLSELYKEDQVLTTEHFAPIKLSEETLKNLNANYNTRLKELNDLSDKLNEVQAQLSMCETYEEKQNVLNTYKILKANGKVNA